MKNRAVLFVDDEINILNSLRRGLIDEEYRCFFANSGEEALSILEKEKICVIVSDMKMPVMDGLKLLKIVKEKYPDIIRLVLSGYTQLTQVLAAVNQADIFKFILKPWKMEEEFIFVIRQAIEYYELQKSKEELKDALEKRNQIYQNMLRATEEKLKSDKIMVENIRKFGDFVFSKLKEKITKGHEENGINKDEVLAHFILLEEMYQDFFRFAIASSNEFNMKAMQSDLTDYLSKINNIKSFEIRTDGRQEISYYGNYKLLFYILNSIFKHVLPMKETYRVIYNIINQMEEKYVNLYSLIELESKNKIQANEVNEKTETVKLYINELCKLFGSKIEVVINENVAVVKVYMRFDLVNG